MANGDSARNLKLWAQGPTFRGMLKCVYFPLEDAKLERLLEVSAATGNTIEKLIEAAVTEFLDDRETRK